MGFSLWVGFHTSVFDFRKRESVMHLSISRTANRLPKRFPIGTTYIVEGQGGESGHLRVFSRYVLLPGGRRINLADDSGGPACRWARGPGRGPSRAVTRGKGGPGRG